MRTDIGVFFYGLFMDADLLRARGAVPTDVQHASIRGFSLRIGARATLVPVNLPEPPRDDERNDAYAVRLEELARRLHLPGTYVERIRDRPRT
jgi:hypothetical protein